MRLWLEVGYLIKKVFDFLLVSIIEEGEVGFWIGCSNGRRVEVLKVLIF